MATVIVSSPYKQSRCYIHERIKSSKKHKEKLQLTLYDIGYIDSLESNSPVFIENKFVKFLLNNLNIIYLNNIWVIYNYNCGVYEQVSEHKLAVIIKFILDCVNPKQWNKALQNNVIDAVRLSANRVEIDDSIYSHLIAVNNGVLNLKTGEVVILIRNTT
jgi:hypothetical protein